MILDDTIAAIASPPGQGAISLIRVSGPRAVEAVDHCWTGASGGTRLADAAPRRVHLGEIRDREGCLVDQVMVVRFKAPASFTGEDVVEVSCHGGILATRQVLDRIVEAGARPAEPGEFTRRAFLNGKLDLTQAEAIMDLIGAQTTLALRAANEQLAGRLGDSIRRLREDLLEVVAHLEAWIDFPEEDIDPDSGAALLARIEAVRDRVEMLVRAADQGRMLREGVRTVIAGAPNVGKSSLLNLLLGFDRAIVSETAGTTRDTIEEVINVGGFPLRLVDTAGLRETADALELEGIVRARRQLESADLVLEVVDRSIPRLTNSSPLESADQLHVRILNKADLAPHPSWDQVPGVALSCLTGSGKVELVDTIRQALATKGGAWEEGGIAVNTRHRDCLRRAGRELEDAARQFQAGSPPEIIAVALRSALDAIGDVVGRVDIEDILGQIFASFCIGK